MKRFFALLLMMTLVMGIAACAPAIQTTQPTATTLPNETTTVETTLERLKLIVQTMPTFNGVLASYIRDQGWAEEAGLELEYLVFPSGAPANEALAAGLWDVGFQGAAYVFGVINNDAKLIGNYEDTGGDTLFVRPNSPILNVKGFNPTYPEVFGDPDTVRGTTIIYAAGTSLHMLVLAYLEKIGLSSDDVNLVPMDFQTGLQTFLLGEADIVALPTPWSLTVGDEHGWKSIAYLRQFTISMGCVIVSNYAYYNKREALTRYMKLVYRAADILEADHNLKARQIMKWYAENGREIDEATAKLEARTRIFITSDRQKELDYGSSEAELADFFASIGRIEPAQAELFKANIRDHIWKAALAG